MRIWVAWVVLKPGGSNKRQASRVEDDPRQPVGSAFVYIKAWVPIPAGEPKPVARNEPDGGLEGLERSGRGLYWVFVGPVGWVLTQYC